MNSPDGIYQHEKAFIYKGGLVYPRKNRQNKNVTIASENRDVGEETRTTERKKYKIGLKRLLFIIKVKKRFVTFLFSVSSIVSFSLVSVIGVHGHDLKDIVQSIMLKVTGSMTRKSQKRHPINWNRATKTNNN